MKTHQTIMAMILSGFALASAHAQINPVVPTGPARPGPEFRGYLIKLFDANPAFTANLEFHSYGAATGDSVTAQGKFTYLNGNTRFEMKMADAGDANLPREDASSLAQLGMNTMIALSRPDLKMDYFVYPGMKAFVRRPKSAMEVAAASADYTLEVTEVGDENVLGQDCVKHKVVASGGPDGLVHESTVWNATDLNDFPIKIESRQKGATVVMLFKDLSLDTPSRAQFTPPADYKEYDNFMSLMHGDTNAVTLH